MASVWDEALGEITKDGIRYVMMRPDVLMGVAHEVAGGGAQTFLAALEQSAFRNAQASFARYRDTDRFGAADFLVGTFKIAASLGWGVWHLEGRDANRAVVRVFNSPFASGYGRSEQPVCGVIAGVLRAVSLVAYDVESQVIEVTCKAQGSPTCLFHISAAAANSAAIKK